VMKQGMGMTMTPQLQQAIKILQMSVVELQQVVNQAVVENPTLEEMDGVEDEHRSRESDQKPEQKDAKIDPLEEMRDKFDWENYLENNSQLSWSGANQKNNNYDITPDYDQIISRPKTLYDHVLWQLRMWTKDNLWLNIGEEIIGNLNDDGYLSIFTEEIAQSLKVDHEEVLYVLDHVQNHFEPSGVAARSLKECLLIQCKALKVDPKIVSIVENNISDLEKKNYPAIAKALSVSLEEVIELCKVIYTLEPKPGRSFSNTQPNYIQPDVYVRKRENKYVILLNEDRIPKVRISRKYQQEVKQNILQADTKKYVKDKLKDAAWLLKSIDQRQKTIYRVTEKIVEKQRDFFEEGPQHLKPMILRDVADELSLHESTISRVTTNKYVHTPHGIYELKYFFNSAIAQADGSSGLANESVKLKIKELIESEDPKKPLSDQALVRAIAEQNIKIARRTIAKYRESLGILPSSKRKKYF